MTLDELTQLFVVIVGLDQRHDPGEVTVRAWHAALKADITLREAMDAVVAHYADSREYIMVADINRGVSAARSELAERRESAARDFAFWHWSNGYMLDNADREAITVLGAAVLDGDAATVDALAVALEVRLGLRRLPPGERVLVHAPVDVLDDFGEASGSYPEDDDGREPPPHVEAARVGGSENSLLGGGVHGQDTTASRHGTETAPSRSSWAPEDAGWVR